MNWKTLFFIGALVCTQAIAQEMAPEKVQGLFIYHFTKYIEWPEDDGKLTIGIIAEEAVYKELSYRFASRSDVEVKYFPKWEDATACDMLFTSTISANQFEELQAKLGNKSILYVSNRNGMATRGSMINFTVQNGRMKFELNEKLMDENNFRVSTELKKLAIIV